VSDEDDSFVEAAGESAEFALKLGASDGIERSEWLIHKKDGRVSGEGAGDTDALALAAGEFLGTAGGKFGGVETNEMQKFLHALSDAGGIPFFKAGDEADILGDGKVGEETGFLNNVSNSASELNGIGIGGGAAFDNNISLGGEEHAINEPEESGLAATTPAE
jgi:hypothetical protein